MKIMYEISVLARYICVWEQGSFVNNYVELSLIGADSL